VTIRAKNKEKPAIAGINAARSAIKFIEGYCMSGM
jgi:hypothetical protein